MLDDTISRIETTIRENTSIPDDKRQELLGLISNLKNEIDSLDAADAGSIARFAESSVKEAVKSQQDPDLLNHSLVGLSLSVKKFEVSHPTLTAIINNIGQTLNRIGI